MEVLIVGASARAAAWSALRAGWKPVAIDRFGDRDLKAIARTQRVPPPNTRRGLLLGARKYPDLPLIYTGAFENDPILVRDLARGRTLLGHSDEVLKWLRAHGTIGRFWHSQGVDAPRVALKPKRLPTDGSWLAKPIRSAGGRAIRPYLGDGPTDGFYFQERIEGRAGSAVFVADAPDRLRLLGATFQLLDGFRYAGSIGPWLMEAPLAMRVARLGEILLQRFPMQGPFGIDFIVRNGVPWPVEINPRYTASVEVLELARGHSVFDREVRHPVPQRFVGKQIVFADRPGSFPHRLEWSLPGLWDVPEIADIPEPGEPIEAGQPVLSVMAEGDSIEAVGRLLHARHQEWLGLLA
ncbi:MAG: ATP-grasp domain-containing protein [Isosphaeraceae bacterium]